MTESVQVALIVGGFSFGGSIALAVIAGWLAGRKAAQEARIRSREKAEDYARQDAVIERANAVAEKAATAATDLKESNEHVAEVARSDAAVARQDRAAASEQLEQLKDGQRTIHTLVNSNLTAQMQDSRDSAALLLAALQENVADKKARRVKPNPATLVAIKLAESKIHELDAQLKDRKNAQEVVNHQAAAAVANA